MGQKSHPIGLRVLKWENEWYSNSKTNTSKLIYQIYKIKYLLIYFFYKKEFLIHSFSSKYIDNVFYLIIDIIPLYRKYNYTNVNFVKFYDQKLILKKKNLIKLFLENFNVKTNFNILSQFFLLKKVSLKYCYRSAAFSYNNSLFFLKNFKKIKLYELKNLISLENLKLISNSILQFQKLPNFVLNVRNLPKLCYISNSFFKKKIQNYRFYNWMYYFYFFNKLKPSSLLMSYIIKKFFETRSLRKKQRSFLKSLKKCLNQYKTHLLSEQVKGIKIHIKGRLNGRNRSSLYKIRIGSVPLSTLSQKILYSFCPAFTIYGSFGIKVWIALN